ncbi:MAG: type II toxin-antitoxin system HicB family antitoxin [Pseudomonadales bacterium]
MLLYPVVIYKDQDSDYGVVIPDLPGCVSAGRDQIEALTQATEAAYTHLEGLVLDGDLVPEPSSLESLQASEELQQGFVCWAVIQIDPMKISSETERFNVVLPRWLVNLIARESENRSAFLTVAATNELKRRHKSMETGA